MTNAHNIADEILAKSSKGLPARYTDLDDRTRALVESRAAAAGTTPENYWSAVLAQREQDQAKRDASAKAQEIALAARSRGY
ncbi:hypothetical protein GCM10023081_38190 [Arthrobacter ginkgonis]|uniref:Uncharacterized protein n=1 Tax=Arthrobacter ginkgonis TaxID=1630594 RepID=A0ABP7D011_9MICC